MKYSRQREEILSAVREAPVHPTADELYRRLRQTDPTLSLGTVYRNLDRLSREGIITRLALPDGRDRFDGNTARHYHLYCTDCGRMIDCALPDMDAVYRRLDREIGFAVQAGRLIFYGICADCRAGHSVPQR